MAFVLLVGSGGFIGAVMRYLVSGLAQRITGNSWFPYGILPMYCAYPWIYR
jgi:CrcB protein